MLSRMVHIPSLGGCLGTIRAVPNGCPCPHYDNRCSSRNKNTARKHFSNSVSFGVVFLYHDFRQLEHPKESIWTKSSVDDIYNFDGRQEQCGINLIVVQLVSILFYPYVHEKY